MDPGECLLFAVIQVSLNFLLIKGSLICDYSQHIHSTPVCVVLTLDESLHQYYLTERESHHGVVPVRGRVTVIDSGSSLTWTTLLHVGLPDAGPRTRASLSPSS